MSLKLWSIRFMINSKSKILLESFIVYLYLLGLTWISFRSLFINALLNLFIFLTINWSLYWLDIIANLSFLFIISVNWKWKSVIKSWNLRSRGKNLFLFKFYIIILIILWLRFFMFVSAFFIKYSIVFSNFLRFSFALST